MTRTYYLTYTDDSKAYEHNGTEVFTRELEALAYSGDDDGKHDHAYTVVDGAMTEVVVVSVKSSAPYPESERETWWIYGTHNVVTKDGAVLDTFNTRISGDI